MLSLQFLRENPDLVRRAIERRHTEAPIAEVLELDGRRRELLAEVEAIRAEKNAISKEIGGLSRLMKTEETKEAKHAEHRRSDLTARSSFIGERLGELEYELKTVEERLRR